MIVHHNDFASLPANAQAAARDLLLLREVFEECAGRLPHHIKNGLKAPVGGVFGLTEFRAERSAANYASVMYMNGTSSNMNVYPVKLQERALGHLSILGAVAFSMPHHLILEAGITLVSESELSFTHMNLTMSCWVLFQPREQGFVYKIGQ